MPRLRWRITTISLVLGIAALLLIAPVFADNGSNSLTSTVSTMASRAQHARTALANGDFAAARDDGEAIEQSWKGIEVTVAQRAPKAETMVDHALDDANEALAESPPPADTGQRLDRLQDALTSLGQTLQSAPSTSSTSTDQVSVGEGIRRLQKADAALANGDVGAARQSFGEFQQHWPEMEGRVAVESPTVYHQIEAQMTSVSTALGASSVDAASARPVIGRMTAELQPLVGQQEHYGPLDAAITLLREGLEALLVMGALLALVTRSGRPDLRWQVWAGGGVGIVASLAVAALLQIVFSHFAVGLNREILEGVTGLGAAAMLLYVSYWMHQQGNLADWRKFLASRTGTAIASGNTLLLPALAFLAVFREGAETILLYVGMAASISLRDMVLGMAIGLVALIALGVALFGFGLRMSLKPFFRAISVLLYYLAFKFVGTGIHALQVAGALPATSADYLPSFGLIGMFPTWQTTAAQALLIAIALVAVAWVAASQRGQRGARAES